MNRIIDEPSDKQSINIHWDEEATKNDTTVNRNKRKKKKV
jgi:hypothetical protein